MMRIQYNQSLDYYARYRNCQPLVYMFFFLEMKSVFDGARAHAL